MIVDEILHILLGIIAIIFAIILFIGAVIIITDIGTFISRIAALVN